VSHTLATFVLLLVACGATEEPAQAEPSVAAGQGGEGHGAGHPGAGPHQGPHAGHQHDFSDAERWAALFDDPARDAWQRPEEVVELLAVERGMTVVDLGAGTGYFLPYLARAVAEHGTVLALDVEPAMVEHMRRRIAEQSIPRAEARVVSPDDPGLAPGSVDRILIVDTWHHIGDRTAYAQKLHAALEPGGSVLVVDFTPESPHGPPPEMRLSASTVATELRAAGFTPELLTESLPYQYALRATRAE